MPYSVGFDEIGEYYIMCTSCIIIILTYIIYIGKRNIARCIGNKPRCDYFGCITKYQNAQIYTQLRDVGNSSDLRGTA